MLAVGCIQAQRCHTGRCPTGVATQSARLARGLDPTLKSVRCAQYVASLRKELLDLAHACGQPHPSLVGLGSVELLRPDGTSSPAIDSTHYSDPSWGELSGSQRDALRAVMEALSPQEAGFGTG